MKTKLLLLICLTLGFSATNMIISQVTDTQTTSEKKYVRIILQNGGLFEGEVIEINESEFLIETPMLGRMRINKMDIATIVYIEADQVGATTVNTRAGDINPQVSRYFFAPSAHQLKKGEGYYHNIMLLYNQVSYGITDNITAGLTMTPFGTGGTVKFGYEINETLHASVGGIGVMPFDDDSKIAGIAFLNLTAGDERKHVTLSYGNGFFHEDIMVYQHADAYTDTDGEYHPSNPDLDSQNYHFDNNGNYHDMTGSGSWVNNSRQSIHMFCVSAMLELNSSTWLMTENYLLLSNSQLLDDNFTIISVGIRKSSRKRDILWDYAMVAIPSEEIAGIPFISATIPF